MTKTVRLSSKRQIAIPRALCERLGIRIGQQLVLMEASGQLVLTPKPASYAKVLRGLGKNVWKGVDPLEYIRRERASWEQKR